MVNTVSYALINPGNDAMASKVHRRRSAGKIRASETSETGGHFVIVMNGALTLDGETLCLRRGYPFAMTKPHPLCGPGPKRSS